MMHLNKHQRNQTWLPHKSAPPDMYTFQDITIIIKIFLTSKWSTKQFRWPTIIIS
ncbi:hypothetical protein OIU77_003340 [Salix suchowensis]|uniref:Uncharacterized protein n=1 Tax=Salix suchowensis TaxID=1278906 RepID=A0ABQ9B0L9_9ROSI|nr:hypothetical protein OIU77_003340 [Salix suchowensis]